MRLQNRMTVTMVNTTASPTSTSMSQSGTTEPLLIAAREFDSGVRGPGAGSVSNLRRCVCRRVFWPLLMRLTAELGSAVASDGVPVCGLSTPVDAGMESQYWFSALSTGFAQPPAIAATDALAGRALPARTATNRSAVRRHLVMAGSA